MNTDSKLLVVGLLLVFLLSWLGTALVAAHAAPPESSGGSGAPAGAQACYALDTTRPEWLGSVVYLPLIVRGLTP